MYNFYDVLTAIKDHLDLLIAELKIEADVSINMAPELDRGDIKKTVFFVSGGGVENMQLNAVQKDEEVTALIRMIVPFKRFGREDRAKACCDAIDLARTIARHFARQRRLGPARLDPRGRITVYNPDRQDPVFSQADPKLCYGQVIGLQFLVRYSEC